MSGRPKLSALFHQGVEIVVPTSVGELVFWVSKLNSFLVEECNHQGRVAASRRKLAIREVGTPEYEEFMLNASALDKDQIIKGLVANKAQEHQFEVYRDLQSDEEWKERLETLEHSDGLPDRGADDPEAKWLLDTVRSYTEEMERRLAQLEEDYTKELSDLSSTELRERYQEAYLEAHGQNAFQTVRKRHELYLSTRECEAEIPAAGERWDHSKCDHSRRALGSPEEVDALPDEIIGALRAAYDGVMVPVDLARFTAGPTSSSDSSGPASSAEGSDPSGRKATRRKPATTSSSPSPRRSRSSATSSSRKKSSPPS